MIDRIKKLKIHWGLVSIPNEWKYGSEMLYKYVDFPQEISVDIVYRDDPKLLYTFVGFNIFNLKQCMKYQFNFYTPFTDYELALELNKWKPDPNWPVNGTICDGMIIKLRDNKKLTLSSVQVLN